MYTTWCTFVVVSFNYTNNANTLTLWRPLGFGDFQKTPKRTWLCEGISWSGMLYRPGKSLKRRGKSSSLHLKKSFCLGDAGFL